MPGWLTIRERSGCSLGCSCSTKRRRLQREDSTGWPDASRSRRWSRCIGGCCCLKAARGGACLAGGEGQEGEEEGGGEGEKEEQEELKIDMENDFSVFYLTTELSHTSKPFHFGQEPPQIF